MDACIESLRQVYELLEDEESRITYLNRLNYLISGDLRYIENIVRTYLPELPRWKSITGEEFLAALPERRGIVLFGAGIRGAQVLPYFCEDRRFLGFCSSTVEKQKNGYLGWPVMSPEELARRRDLSVVVSSPNARQEILQILREMGYPEELIFTLDGLEISYNDQYFGPAFMSYGEEVFVDVGSCNLRSAIALREHCGQIKKVYALEPDPENFRTCQRNREKYHFHQVELLPFGAWSENTTLYFEAKSSGTSCVSTKGEIRVPVKRIDDIVEEGVTFIKMDIEGAELEALKGAQNTIRRDRPKLAICIYHKPEDMTQIPLYIKSLVPEYKFYVRHHSNCPGETVLYAVMGG